MPKTGSRKTQKYRVNDQSLCPHSRVCLFLLDYSISFILHSKPSTPGTHNLTILSYDFVREFDISDLRPSFLLSIPKRNGWYAHLTSFDAYYRIVNENDDCMHLVRFDSDIYEALWSFNYFHNREFDLFQKANHDVSKFSDRTVYEICNQPISRISLQHAPCV